MTANISAFSIANGYRGAPMRGLSRRAFFGVSVGGLSTLHGAGTALAALPVEVFNSPARANVAYASALNLGLFLQNTDALGLTGLLSMRPVEGGLGSLPAAPCFCFRSS